MTPWTRKVIISIQTGDSVIISSLIADLEYTTDDLKRVYSEVFSDADYIHVQEEKEPMFLRNQAV